MKDKVKYICRKCGKKFYLINNNIEKCLICKSTSTIKLEAFKLPLQIIYYDDILKKVEVLY